MFKVLKADQRPRQKGRLCETYSYLPFYGGYVKPFGDLIGIEEVLVNPGGELYPMLEEREMVFIGRAGKLEIFQGEGEPGLLRKNTVFVARPGDESLKLENQRESGLSRIVSLGFRLGSNLAPDGLSSPLEVKFRGVRTSLQTIAAAGGGEDCPGLSLDAEVSLAQLGKGERLTLETLPTRRVMVVVLEGLVSIGKNSLRKNDSVMVMGEPMINLSAHELARLLTVDLPEYLSPRELEQSEEKEPEKGEISVWRFDQ